MKKKKNGIPDLNDLTPEEKMKLEIAQEIGVYDKVLTGGWRCLSARESGKIGGIITSRRREQERKEKDKKGAVKS